MRALLAIVAALTVGSCTEPRSEVCRKVCKREADCIEETSSKIPFEEKECVAACTALQNDSADNGAKVQRHIDCVGRQGTCTAVLSECK